MESQELIHFIRQQLASGTPPDELKTLLAHHGWPPEAIDRNMDAASRPSVPASSGAVVNEADAYVRKRSMIVWGIIFLCLPILLIVVALLGYAISQFWISNILSSAPPSVSGAVEGLGQMDKRVTAAQIMNVAWGLIGLVGVIFFFISIPLGIIFLAKGRGELKPGVLFDERSGKGEASVIPPEIAGWNWGAAFLSLWWGAYYRVWIMLLIFAPVIGGIWWIVLGIKGNEWAWSKNKWLSVEHFKRSQKKWRPWAIAVLVCNTLMIIGALYLIPLVAYRAATSPLSNLGAYNDQGFNSPLTEGGARVGVPLLGTNTIFKGTVLNVTGQTFTVDYAGVVYSVDFSEATVVPSSGLAELKAGDEVFVSGTMEGKNVKATGITIVTLPANF